MADSNMQSELRSLQNQVAELTQAISRQGSKTASTLRDRTSEVVDTASRRAQDAAGYTRAEAETMAGVFREHPTAASGALLTAGVIGGIIGYLVGTSAHNSHDSHRRWY